jgi:hypothetical protein
MKAITLTEPWASLVAIGVKTLETRSWSTSYRGPIAIHAAKTLPRWAADFLANDPDVLRCFREAGLNPFTGRVGDRFLWNGRDPDYLKESATRWLMQSSRGHVVAITELIDCQATRLLTEDRWFSEPVLGEQELHFGDYTPGRFAFRLANVARLEAPVPATGALGIWDWDEAGWSEGRAA